MNVTLPSSATVTYRDKLTAADKFAVQSSIRFSMDASTGLQSGSGSVINDMRNALLANIVESWSYDNLPVPSLDPSSLGKLDIDDYNALADAVEPLLDKVVNSGPNRIGRSGS